MVYYDDEKEPERYYDWMLWRLRKENQKSPGGMNSVREHRRLFDWSDRTMNTDGIYKREVQEMQKMVHGLQMRVKDLAYTIHNLEHKVKVLGGDPNQYEMEF